MSVFQLGDKQLKRIKSIRKRVDDQYKHSAGDIKEGKFVTMTSKIFEEMRFLLQVLDNELPTEETEEVEEEDEEKDE